MRQALQVDCHDTNDQLPWDMTEPRLEAEELAGVLRKRTP